MASPRRFAFLKPNALGTVAFAYGSTSGVETGTVVAVSRVASGRWNDLGPFETEIAADEFDARSVTQEEAASGIGTYLGAYICAARTPPASARVWDYGVVVDYTWNGRSGAGVLHVLFGDETLELSFDEGAFVPLALEAYVLRPCFRLAVMHTMLREMRDVHDKVTAHFNGQGRNATRNSKTIRRAVGQGVLDEHQLIPVFDVMTARVGYVPISYVLDFVYYSGGRRRRPSHVCIGDSVFDGVVNGGRTSDATGAQQIPTDTTESRSTRRGAAEQLELGGSDPQQPVVDAASATRTIEYHDNSGILSDSDDDSEGEAIAVPSPAPMLPQRRPASKALDANVSRLQRMRSQFSDDPDMQRDLDQFILFRETGSASGCPSSIRRAYPTSVAGDGGAQFQPTALQSAVHDELVNGGLSTMHFARVDPDTKRAQARKYEMRNFSRKNPLPKPAVAASVSDVVDAIDVLSAFSSIVFGPPVLNLLQAARQFLLSPRIRADIPDSAAIAALVQYVDERFERFRTRIARRDRVAAASIAAEFSTEHVLYTRLVQAVIQRRIASLAPEPLGNVNQARGHARQNVKDRNVRYVGGAPRKAQRTVPLEVLAALPKQQGKSLCMRYISNQGCRGQGTTCVFEERGHFQPNSLPSIVRDHISKHYGGVRPVAPKEEASEA